MAAIVLQDRLRDAFVERGVAGIMRAARTAKILMPTSGYEPYELLNRALLTGALPQPGDSHPEDDQCLLSRARAVPFSSNGVDVTLIYERVPLVTYEEHNAVVPVRTQNLPGTRRQIMASYAGANWPGTALRRSCSIVYRCPMRKAILGRAKFGLPLDILVPPETKDAVASVNDRYWMGMDRGYWLFDGLQAKAIEPNDAFEYALCYYVYGTFYSQVKHDWSYWQFMQLPNGHFVKVDPSVIDAVVSLGYDVAAPSYRGDNHAATEDKGLAVAYPYPALNFYELFGVQ
jgi:hypothetical protein